MKITETVQIITKKGKKFHATYMGTRWNKKNRRADIILSIWIGAP